MEKQRLIYCLKCPVRDRIHYIGKSSNGLTRPRQHFTTQTNEKMEEWIKDLAFLGHKPTIEVLEYIDDCEDIDSKEKWWINKSLNDGDLLLNSCLITPMVINPKMDEITGDIQDSVGMLEIATFIKERRKLLGYTQEEFAGKIGVALTVIRKIEQGHTNMQLKKLLEILALFGKKLTIK